MLTSLSPGLRRTVLATAALCAVVLALFAFSTSAYAAEFIVNPAPGCSDLAPTSQYCTIQAALDAANVNDTVKVYPGNYSEVAVNRAMYPGGDPVYTFGLAFEKNGITLQGVDTGGNPITNVANVLATIETNATNGFGPSGVWVSANDVSIIGVKIGKNAVDENKTIEVIGDNFTLAASEVGNPAGYSAVYISDFRYVVGPPATCVVNSYTITGNRFLYGESVDVASGAGGCGTGTRVISNNIFYSMPDQDWPGISFNSVGSTVGWYVYPVGAAQITGNTFGFAELYVRWRGNGPSFDWAQVWNTNNFPHAVQAGPNPPGSVRSYSYTNVWGYYFPVTERIASILWPNQFVAPDTVIVKAGSTAAFYVDPVVKKLDSGVSAFSVDVKYQDPADKDYGATDFVLDYDESCLALASVTNTPVAFSTLDFSVAHDAATGAYAFALWDAVAPSAALQTGTAATLNFNILPACAGTDRTFAVLVKGGDDAATCTPFNGDASAEEACLVVGANIPVDFNAAPTDIALAPSSFNEMQTPPTVVGTLSAVDPDGNAPTFTLVAGSGDTDNGSFSIDGNQLSATVTADFETKPSYSVRVRVIDGRGGSYEEALTITVINVNLPPTAIVLSPSDFVGPQPNGDLATFIVTDPEAPGAPFVCEFVTAPVGPLTISGDKLVVTGGPLGTGSYSFTARCKDSSGDYSPTVSFVVNVYGQASLDILGEDQTFAVPGPKLFSFPYVARETMTKSGIEVVYAANGNEATSLKFAVTAAPACVASYTAVAGAGVNVAQSGNTVTVTPTGASIPSGTIATLNVTTQACPGSDLRNDTVLTPVVSEFKKGALDLSSAVNAGMLIVIENSARGDCNANGKINSGDYYGTVLEIFGFGAPNDPYNFWLDTSRYGHNGSPYGCDSNQSAYIETGDVVCTVMLSFNKVCAAAGDLTPGVYPAAAMASLSAQPLVNAGGATSVPVSVSGADVKALSFAMKFAPDAGFNGADADGNGIPDGVSFKADPKLLHVAEWDAASSTLKVAVVGTEVPMPSLNGQLVSVNLAGSAAGITMSELSASDGEGFDVALTAQVGPSEELNFRTFLPVLQTPQ